ncbi:MAG TPA: EamA family transporter [Candidatus Methylomirabilis sp.]|nr:EamA family transporter [Candidatus Methylomirabilis sp.]
MWLFIAVISYLINAGVYVGDKFLLSKKIHSSIAYAFYVCIWSFLNVVLLWFAPFIPTWSELLLDFSVGIIFMLTLIFWYKALHQSEATRVVPIVGALIPIFSLIFGFIFLGDKLTERQVLAFLILIIGGILISVKHTRFYQARAVANRVRQVVGQAAGEVHAADRPTWRLIINSAVAAFFFAVCYALTKYIYNTQPFIGGFVWSRLGSFIGVFFLLLVPAWRKLIFQRHLGHSNQPRNLTFFFFVRVAAAGAFILFNRAISLGDVSLVTALQGSQYIFLFLIVLVLSEKFPQVLKEEVGRSILFQKIMGMILVGIGLYMLAVIV